VHGALKLAKENLAQAVPTISRTQAEKSSRPKVAYGNGEGGSILGSLLRIGSVIAELREGSRVSREERRVLPRETARLSEETRSVPNHPVIRIRGRTGRTTVHSPSF